MGATWKLQEAKAKFSQVVENALKAGPQVVTRRGKKTVVVLSVTEFEQLCSKKMSFKEFLLTCPKLDEPLEIERQKDYPRSMEW